MKTQETLKIEAILHEQRITPRFLAELQARFSTR